MNAPPNLPSELSEQHKGHGANWYKWLHHLIDKPGVIGLELGTWKGESAEWMLDHIFTHPTSVYWCVDTFEGSDEHHLAGIDCSANELLTSKRLERFGARAMVVKGRTADVLRGQLRTLPIDFAYIDAAHDAMNVLRDSVLAFDMLKPGGTILWDDFGWTVMEAEIDRPALAINSFLACYSRQLEVIGVGWQVAARKL